MEGERTARADDERLIFSAAGGHAPAAGVAPFSDAPWERDTASAGARRRFLWGRNIGRLVAEAVELELARGTGFVLCPVFLAAGAVAYFTLPFEPDIPVLATCAAVAAVGAFAVRAGSAARLALIALLLILLGALSGAVETWRHSTMMLGSSISSRITGRVVGIEDRANGRKRLTIDLTATERPVLRYAPDRVRATARELPPDLRPGGGVNGVVRLLPATGPARPFGYDFAFENYFDDIGANGFFLTGPFAVELEESATVRQRFSAWVETLRLRLAAHIRARIGGPEGEVAAALVTGVRGGIPDDVTDALRTAGLAHVLAISGLHMALVAGTMIWTVRLCFALFPGFSSRYPVKKYAAIAGLAALVLYLVMSGAAVAAQRAFIMFAVMLVAVLFDRAALTMRNLAIAAIIILAIAPHEVMGPSFQMSFAATAALIGAYGWYAEYRMRRAAGALRPDRGPIPAGLRLVLLFMGGLAMTSVIAGFATGLFAAWHFQRVAPLGLVANLAAMPIVTVAVMPLAVAGALTLPFGIDGVFFAGMGWALALVIDIARTLAAHSPFDVVGAIPPAAVIVLTVALVFATVATTWLRALSMPFLAVGVLLLVMREQPDLLVSEDARLIAMPLSSGELAVNRKRPSTFTLDIWRAALQKRVTAGPESVETNAFGPPSAERGFVCTEGLCIARHASGAIVAHADTGKTARQACAYAALIIVDDATTKNVCPGGAALVATKKDLALRGSAAVRFTAEGLQIRYAIGAILRPWHDHRRYSREARGMAPFKRKPKKAKISSGG